MNLTVKRIGVALLGLALFASIAIGAVQKASANEGNEKKENKENKVKVELKLNDDLREKLKEAGTQTQISIGPNGKVLVRGAKVTDITSTTIGAEVVWGSYVSKWTVNTSNAKFIRRSDGRSALSEIAVGHIISFSGMLDTTATTATVKADTVKDWSVTRADVPSLGTLQGELKGVTSTTVPTTIAVKVGNVDYAVNVSASTAILNKNWGLLSLGSFVVGDTVRFYGSINGTTSDATVVRNVSR